MEAERQMNFVVARFSSLKRHIVILDWCCMCKQGGERVEHLLLHSFVAGALWYLVFALFGVSWVMPKMIIQMLASRQGKFNNHSSVKIWKAAPLCIM